MAKLKVIHMEKNAMWKVVYNDNEWSLSGYPDNKVEISEWTEIY